MEKWVMQMNNEPIAWMNPKTLECGYGGEIDWEDTGCIPLYTHLAKTLTDEEIDNAITEAFNRWARFGYAEGLKKASEK